MSTTWAHFSLDQKMLSLTVIRKHPEELSKVSDNSIMGNYSTIIKKAQNFRCCLDTPALLFTLTQEISSFSSYMEKLLSLFYNVVHISFKPLSAGCNKVFSVFRRLTKTSPHEV